MMKRSLYIFTTVILIGITAWGRRPYRILLDADVNTDDLFALVYILKLNRSQFDLQAVTITTNSWADAGHAVNKVYGILYMMGRDDVAVGMGGEGGMLQNGTILADVGGYHPIIEQISLIFMSLYSFRKMALLDSNNSKFVDLREIIQPDIAGTGRLVLLVWEEDWILTHFGFRKNLSSSGQKEIFSSAPAHSSATDIALKLALNYFAADCLKSAPREKHRPLNRKLFHQSDEALTNQLRKISMSADKAVDFKLSISTEKETV